LQANRRPRGPRLTVLLTGSVMALLLAASPALAGDTGGAAPLANAPAPLPVPIAPVTTPLLAAQLSADGRTAIAPASAPDQVKSVIYAANQITRKPYRYGGGHRRNFQDSAYDCSGSVSYALHGGNFLKKPLDSSSLMGWGDSGPGQWITVYTNRGHAYVVVAALRLDTSGSPSGPRWRRTARPSTGFTPRHPAGF
jgi:cell wall-associated NlpC family hydrolase